MQNYLQDTENSAETQRRVSIFAARVHFLRLCTVVPVTKRSVILPKYPTAASPAITIDQPHEIQIAEARGPGRSINSILSSSPVEWFLAVKV